MKKKIFLVSLVLLLLFYGFSREVKRGFLRTTDFNVTVRLQDHMPKRLDSIWEEAGIFVTPTVSVIVVGAFTLVALRKRGIRALVIPALFILVILGELFGKTVVHHPAPPFFMLKHPTTIFPQFYVNEQFSYPSGHTARAVFIAIVAWLLLGRKRWLAVALAGYVVVVAVGKMYLGEHWLSDVIGGLLLGSGLGLLTIPLTSPIITTQ